MYVVIRKAAFTQKERSLTRWFTFQTAVKPELSCSETGDQELLGFPRGLRVPDTWTILCCWKQAISIDQ